MAGAFVYTAGDPMCWEVAEPADVVLTRIEEARGAFVALSRPGTGHTVWLRAAAIVGVCIARGDDVEPD